jgi:SRSO17 transposase
MVEYAHRRYGVEQFHEEAKSLLGWDQYQGRRWTEFHRNSVLVMLAYSFLVLQEWQQQQEVTLRRSSHRPQPHRPLSARTSAGLVFLFRWRSGETTLQSTR